MSKQNFVEQAEKLKCLVGSARLQTSSPALASAGEVKEPDDYVTSDVQHAVNVRAEPPKTKAKNLKAIPLSYFEAHAELKLSSKTSLDFSSYIIEAIREKLERDGAIGQ
ncbi:TPA: molecular chaperone GroEL [Salmonella enterica subsp. enterica serovar Strathcona]|nr:molecular chaperone GroEL [Salmonella enterica subsp. enterica serovar Coeln]EHE6020013.1 molecular chaperone GroEL [Salmonella enterica]